MAAVLQAYTFDAYGNAHGFDAATALTTWLQADGQRDPTTGLNYNLARWYDPRTGRLIRLDPFFGNPNDPQSFNKSLYAHGDPTNNNDPNGEFALAVSLGAMTGGAIIGYSGAARAGQVWDTSRAALNSIFPNKNIDALFTLANNPAPGDALINSARDYFTSPPGLIESFIPVWGPFRSLAYDISQGNWGWAAFDALAMLADLVTLGRAGQALSAIKNGLRGTVRVVVVKTPGGVPHAIWEVGARWYHAWGNYGLRRQMKVLALPRKAADDFIREGRRLGTFSDRTFPVANAALAGADRVRRPACYCITAAANAVSAGNLRLVEPALVSLYTHTVNGVRF